MTNKLTDDNKMTIDIVLSLEITRLENESKSSDSDLIKNRNAGHIKSIKKALANLY